MSTNASENSDYRFNAEALSLRQWNGINYFNGRRKACVVIFDDDSHLHLSTRESSRTSQYFCLPMSKEWTVYPLNFGTSREWLLESRSRKHGNVIERWSLEFDSLETHDRFGVVLTECQNRGSENKQASGILAQPGKQAPEDKSELDGESWVIIGHH
ncbi:hypothetical protein CONPUDRAFT_73473 [Coniophora puteana RWD-64-598 SS2]|uniref:Uncharacterized protein n=1 Tax=Coniophora puteana (strain RWD-64-598) TaxID=741705 RepID=A0A5M3MM86_CONPW|nr:uncharacterized protein CONPUDRAFT_73473 [Coniophora puteana RWD-64-598 SS2]EIW80322.1 hypothetical protein CONPUDRAFT_73473 [Coniophora puteana RWD-64-598 SS2]